MPLRKSVVKASPASSNTLFVTLALSIVLYLSSLTVPAINLEGGQQHYGFAILLYGWFGVLKGEFAWCANLLLLPGLVALLTRQNLAACVVAIGCIVLGLLALRTTSLPTSLGNESRVIGFTIGYYLWIGSFVVLLVGAFKAGMASRQQLS
jgi:hypothetical protein